MPGFYWGIYGDYFNLKISDTGMPTVSRTIEALAIERKPLSIFMYH